MRTILCSVAILAATTVNANAAHPTDTVSILSLSGLVTYATMEDYGTDPGWVIQGEKQGTDMFTPAIPKDRDDFFKGGQGFLRLTTTQFDRAGVYFTNVPVWSTDFGIDAEIRVGAGGGGIAFSLIEVPFAGATVDAFTNIILGGFGQFLGVPRGPALTNDGIGWYPVLNGNSLQFFTSSNDLIPTATEMTTGRDLVNWLPVPGSLFGGTFVTNNVVYPNGFVRFKLNQTMQGADALFELTWGPSFSTTNSWIIPNFPQYPAYFGVSAATGPIGATHDVRHFALYGDPVPEPTSVVAALAFLALVRRRR